MARWESGRQAGQPQALAQVRRILSAAQEGPLHELVHLLGRSGRGIAAPRVPHRFDEPPDAAQRLLLPPQKAAGRRPPAEVARVQQRIPDRDPLQKGPGIVVAPGEEQHPRVPVQVVAGVTGVEAQGQLGGRQPALGVEQVGLRVGQIIWIRASFGFIARARSRWRPARSKSRQVRHM